MGRTACGLLPDGHEVPGVEGEHRFDGLLGCVLVNRYSSAATGRLELSASPGSKGLQPVISTSAAPAGRSASTVPNGKRVWKVASAKARQAVGGAAGAVAGAGRAEELPAPAPGPSSTRATWRLPLTRDGGEDARLVEDLRPVAQRDVRERAGAFQADHARADAAHREGHLVQVLAGVFAIEAPLAARPAALEPRDQRGLRPGGSRLPDAPPTPTAPTAAADSCRNFRRGSEDELFLSDSTLYLSVWCG